MIRLYRLLCYFTIGLFIGAYSVLSFADTIPADYQYQDASWFGYWTKSPQLTFDMVTNRSGYLNQFCVDNPNWTNCRQGSEAASVYVNITSNNAMSEFYGVANQTCPSGYTFNGLKNGELKICKSQVPGCPSGYTLDAGGTTCSTVDCPLYGTSEAQTGPTSQPTSCSCPSGTKWSPEGGCRKSCDNVGESVNGGNLINIQSGANEGCLNGCGVQHTSGTSYKFKDGSISAPATYTGWACAGTGAGAPPAPAPEPDSPQNPPDDLKTPDCGAGDGVVTSSSGAVKCLPSTPQTSKPIVTNEKTTDVKSDGSAKTTETVTTKDPATGAVHKNTTETITPKPDGTDGLAGSSGTSTSATDAGATNGDGTGDEQKGQSELEPDSPLCKKGEVKEKGVFDTEQDAQLEQEKAKLVAKFNEVKAAAQSLFSGSVAQGGGSLPCWAPITILGHSFSLCLSAYAGSLSVVGSYVMLAAALLAAFIVLRR